MLAVLPPELEALIVCGASPPEAVERFSKLLARPLNWPMLVELAEAEKMLPLLSRTLSQCPADQIPPATLADVRSRAASKAMHALSMAGELTRVLRRFEAAGLTAIAFKGPTLALLAYGNLALRDAADLDILVPQHQIASAMEILSAEGYYKKSPRFHAGLAGDNEVSLRRRDPACEVDLHWQFSPPYFLPFDPDRAAARSIAVSTNGLVARTLCREDLLLYLSIHGARNCWPLKSICDVAALTRSSPIDWADVLREADRAHCWRTAAVGLELAATLFQAPVPPDVWKRIKHDRAAGRIAAHVLSNLNRCVTSDGSAPSGALLHLRMVEGGPGKLRYIWRRAFQPNQYDVDYFRLPQPISAAYYVIRPFRVAWDALRHINR
jgi:hypothetical protein